MHLMGERPGAILSFKTFLSFINRLIVMEMQETQVPSLSWEDPLEEGMATHSSVLAWRIPGKGEPGVLLAMGSHRVGHD